MKKIVFSMFLMSCGFIFSVAQSTVPQVLSTSGWYTTGGGFALSQTIGEMCLVQTFSKNNNILTQGFQQPWDFSTEVQSIQASGGIVNLFPNPASNCFNLNFEFPSAGKLSASIFDISGKKMPLLFAEEYSGGVESVLFNGASFAAGAYFVKTDFDTNRGDHYSQTIKLLIVR